MMSTRSDCVWHGWLIHGGWGRNTYVKDANLFAKLDKLGNIVEGGFALYNECSWALGAVGGCGWQAPGLNENHRWCLPDLDT